MEESTMSRSATPFLAPASAIAMTLGAILGLATSTAAPSSAMAEQSVSPGFGTRHCNRTDLADSKTAFAAGALAAGDLAQMMKAPDYSCIGWALGRATSNATVTWESPADRARFSVTPTRTYDSMAGERCRDYVIRAVVDNRSRENAQSACRNSSGAWHLYVAGGGNYVLP
jgi:surface antigen